MINFSLRMRRRYAQIQTSVQSTHERKELTTINCLCQHSTPQELLRERRLWLCLPAEASKYIVNSPRSTCRKHVSTEIQRLQQQRNSGRLKFSLLSFPGISRFDLMAASFSRSGPKRLPCTSSASVTLDGGWKLLKIAPLSLASAQKKKQERKTLHEGRRDKENGGCNVVAFARWLFTPEGLTLLSNCQAVLFLYCPEELSPTDYSYRFWCRHSSLLALAVSAQSEHTSGIEPLITA